MLKNILIINNDWCQYHFTSEVSETFELTWLSQREITIPTNSPLMTVLRSVAYLKSLPHLQRVSEPGIAERLALRSTVDMQIKNISPTKVAENDATVDLTIVTDGHEREERFILQLLKQGWIICGWSIKQ